MPYMPVRPAAVARAVSATLLSRQPLSKPTPLHSGPEQCVARDWLLSLHECDCRTCSVVLGSSNSLGDGRVIPHRRSSHTACSNRQERV
jgi:hypothetical protein